MCSCNCLEFLGLAAAQFYSALRNSVRSYDRRRFFCRFDRWYSILIAVYLPAVCFTGALRVYSSRAWVGGMTNGSDDKTGILEMTPGGRLGHFYCRSSRLLAAFASTCRRCPDFSIEYDSLRSWGSLARKQVRRDSREISNYDLCISIILMILYMR